MYWTEPCLLFAYAMFGLGSLGCDLVGRMGGPIAAQVGGSEFPCYHKADTAKRLYGYTASRR